MKAQQELLERTRSKGRLRRAGAIVVCSAMAVTGVSLGLASSASAAGTLGSLTFQPTSGQDTTPINMTTVSNGPALGCPAAATRVKAVVNGPTGWNNITVTSNTSNGLSTSSDFSVPIGDTFSGIASTNGLTIIPGAYVVQLICQNNFGTTVYGTFEGTITFTDATHFTTVTAASTATAVTASPVSPSTAGTSVTFTATVTPSAAGTVQFQDGGVNLGSPATVTAGAATLTTSTLAVGSHPITAVFTPTDTNAFTGSTSPVSTYVVSATPPTSTTTSLSAPAVVAQNTPAAFTVTTTPGTTSGSVVLKEGTTTVGTGTVTNGSGTVSATFTTQGSHTVAATFTPTGNFSPSTSQSVTVNVGAPPANSASETIETTIAAGSLTISVANTSTVVLPTPVLDQTAGLLLTSGPINPVTVTDTRAGAPGFTVSGLVTDFINGTGDQINGYNLGWTPNIVDAAVGMVITAGPNVPSAPGAQPGTTPSNAGQGLKASRLMATDAPGGLGTTHLGAVLTLAAPTNTKAGTYDATLTLTAI